MLKRRSHDVGPVFLDPASSGCSVVNGGGVHLLPPPAAPSPQEVQMVGGKGWG